jgi:photosystem II stability/assembly factor-like uncharacterized protein
MTTCLAPNGPSVYATEGSPRQLVVATADGVVTLERQGAGGAWDVARRELKGLHISSLLFEPRRGGLFAGVHDGGLYASMDGGQTWERRMRGITQEHVFTLASVERDGGVVLYAGTEPVPLFESTDYGETWEELPTLAGVPGTDRWMFPAPPNIAHVKDIIFDPRDSRTMYVGVEQGALLKSTDAGRTWRELDRYSKPDDPVYKDVHRLVMRPSNPDALYMTGGAGLYLSTDGGETWEQLSTTRARIGYPDALLISPFDNDLMFMAGAIASPGEWRRTHDADAGIARSRDGGRTWELLTRGLPEHIYGNMEAMSMSVWPDGFAMFAGTTDGDVFASEDQGESWSRIAGGLAPVSKGGHYRALTAAARR